MWRRVKHVHLHNNEFLRRVFSGTQLFSETQSDAALRRLAAVRTEVVQFWWGRREKSDELCWIEIRLHVVKGLKDETELETLELD